MYGIVCDAPVCDEAHLAVHQVAATATEFQKILDHPGVIGNEYLGLDPNLLGAIVEV